MRNNILGGLVIFFVVVTCLLMLDDISSPNKENYTVQPTETEQPIQNSSDMAVVDSEE
ncbi:hypothetical protein HNV08_02465 [Winogradskyella eckloniae]|uniref:hypothetical protein n=1 Tax=Winogradskyella eckloniae TaxID=1089306 RepID=UPI00156674EF|nr:hypothetical protein [Winogradskyella eckloniae]NRD18898.1 hypothetical protein [Winogradskyella eckloniae]